jgi:hypothetical protein
MGDRVKDDEIQFQPEARENPTGDIEDLLAVIERGYQG